MVELVAPDRRLRETPAGLQSSIPEHERETTYDRQAHLYDRIIGSAPYNPLVWGTSTAHYAEFARRAVADADGPLLDAGCGMLVFTASAYRDSSRPLVLTDRSEGMLVRAARRLDAPHAMLL